jgi:hypothetical protein
MDKPARTFLLNPYATESMLKSQGKHPVSLGALYANVRRHA